MKISINIAAFAKTCATLLLGFSPFLLLAGCGSSGGVGGMVPDPVVNSDDVVFSTDFEIIPVRVTEPTGVERVMAPVSGSIPFARGVLMPVDVPRFALVDASLKRVVSLQTPTVLTQWNDGSVKWLLLDFQVDVAANTTSTYALGLTDKPLAAGPAITIVETAAGFDIDTGKLKTSLSKTGFGLFDGAWVDRNGDGSYSSDEQVVSGPGQMFVDLDATAPGAADAGVTDYPDTDFTGMEGGNWMRDSQSMASTRYLASLGDYDISLFRNGGSHVVFKLEGWHRAVSGRQFAKYTLYLHFYAEQSIVRLSHSWIMTGDPQKNFIRRMAIEIPFAGSGTSYDYTVGGRFETAGSAITLDPNDPPYIPMLAGPSNLHTGQVDASGEVSVLMLGPDKYHHNVALGAALPVTYTVSVDGSQVASGERPSGWVGIDDGKIAMAMGIRDFWREHPKQIAYRDGKMIAYLWPDDGNKTMDLRRRYAEVRGTVSQGFGKSARREFVVAGSAVGVAKTTDLWISFHAGDTLPASLDSSFHSFEKPLLPFVSGEYNVATGVFGPISAYDPVKHFRLENYLDLMLARIARSQDEYGWTGMFDYGDYLTEFGKQNYELDIPANPQLYSNWGYAGWLQEGYRFGQFALVQYFRSGRYHYFDIADRWLRHTRDVDGVYWDTPDDGLRPQDNQGNPRLGGGHRHDQQHWGAYMAGYGIPTIAMVHHYAMTGEGRDLDAMRDNADWILNAGNWIENYSEYSVLYMAEALGDAALAATAWSRNQVPESAFGRATYDSGMGLMLYDIQTGGETQVRERLRDWANLNESSAAYLRAYLEAVEGTGTYASRIQSDYDAAFPASSINNARYAWSAYTPTDFRDVFSKNFMPQGPWQWPLRMLEGIQFDGPDGMGNDPGRHANQMALIWSMPFVVE